MLGLRLLIVVLLLLRLGVRSGGGFRIGLGLGLGFRLLVGLLLRRDGIVHRLGCLGYRGLVLGFDGLGQFLARLVILHVAVAGLQQGFRRVDGLRQLRVVHRVHRLLQAPGVLLVPCGRIVQFVDRRFKPVLAVGHAALVFRRFHVQRGFQRVDGLRVLHLIGLDLQQVGRVAVDERVPVVHRAARRVGGRGARGLRLGQSAVRPYFPSDAAGHHKRQRAQARDQRHQPLRPNTPRLLDGGGFSVRGRRGVGFRFLFRFHSCPFIVRFGMHRFYRFRYFGHSLSEPGLPVSARSCRRRWRSAPFRFGHLLVSHGVSRHAR